ncbi:MAG: hypothetical protein WAL36_08965 [Pseudolabrys sp.]
MSALGQKRTKYCDAANGAKRKNANKELSRAALVQGPVPEHFMTEPFNLFFQLRLAAPEFDKHLAVVIRAMEQCLVDLIFEPFKVNNEGWVRHVVLNDPECR